jgi:hypothetical protein
MVTEGVAQQAAGEGFAGAGQAKQDEQRGVHGWHYTRRRS